MKVGGSALIGLLAYWQVEGSNEVWAGVFGFVIPCVLVFGFSKGK